MPGPVEQAGAVAPMTMLAAEAAYRTNAHFADVVSTMRSPGSLSADGVVSATEMVKTPLVLLPCASVAVHVTVVCPSRKIPGPGEQAGATAPLTMSAAEAS